MNNNPPIAIASDWRPNQKVKLRAAAVHLAAGHQGKTEQGK